MPDKKEAKETIHIGDNAQIGEAYTGGKRQINTGGGTYVEGDIIYKQPKPDTPPISLEEARSILAEMPTTSDEIHAPRNSVGMQRSSVVPLPPVRTLPVGSRMVFGPYKHFVGRERELCRLASILKGEQGAAAIGQLVATTGLGGIGKTQLAVEFAHRYGQYFAGGLFWLDFSNAGGINNEVARCGGIDGMNLLDGFENLPLPDQVRLVQRAWRKPLPRLLIFDNCEDEALVDEWRPKTGGCRVLITSRRGEWDVALAISQVRLDTLTPAESVRLLGHLAPRLSTEEKMTVAEALGHFPLALHLAGSFLKRYKRVEASRYLEEVEKKTLHHPSLEGKIGKTPPLSPTKHEQHVARTFAVSWERLDKSDPIDQLAQQLFLHAAYFAPGVPIPPDLWHLTLAEQDTEPPTLTEYDYEDAQYRLLELGLLEEEPTGFVIHRLLAAFAHIQPIPQPQQAVEQTLLNEANHLLQTGYPAALQAWQPHLRHLTDAATNREDELAASLCNTMGYYLINIIGDYKNARSYYERALAIHQKIKGQQHSLTAKSLNNLGALLQAQGRYKSALPYYERALAIAEKVLGEEHPDTTISLNNLGDLLRAMGQYESARPYFERALTICEKVLGFEHPNTATSLNNLGKLLHAQGQYESARPYYECTLAICEKVLGFEHPLIAESLNNLGDLLRAMGQYESARLYYECALAIREKVLGEQHPLTAGSLNNLGLLLDSQRQYESARAYYERALAIYEKILGEQHPDTATSLNNLGGLLQAQRQYESARSYYKRALAIFEKVLGFEHPNTAASLNSLGGLLYAQRQYESARPYYERALAIREKALGFEHPDTARSLNSLGGLLYAQGQYESARLYVERAQAIFEKRLGANHPDTQTVRRNLARLGGP